ncbi:MAG: ATP-binding cassette domain-containing protein [Candidatus Humimicrobiaceae bacterium]
MTLENKKIILEGKNIKKHFGGVQALCGIDFELYEGEILGIVGDNGAGKSTLIKIISGVYKKDEGEIYYYGEKVEINSPIDAKELGIETVYQDLALVDELDVPSNIFLGREITRLGKFGKILGFMNYKKMYDQSSDLISKLKANVPSLFSRIRYLSGGQRQAIALSKAVFWGRKIIILDEPTAALGVKESRNAMDLIKTLKEHNMSIIIISHNLQHVFNLVDRIFVLRMGERVGVVNAHETSADEIVSMITGAKVV